MSLTEWGANCRGTKTGGPWSEHEKTWHINCLELLTATLAIKCFARDMRGITILLMMDNRTAVAYVKELGGVVSQKMKKLAKNLWLWCMERDIVLRAQHLPGVMNTIVDEESRVIKGRADWKLNPAVFRKIQEQFGPLKVDLFVSRLSAQLPTYFSWIPDPEALATDAFTQDWSSLRGYANPPWGLLNRVLP